eukprot:SAG11_NODE_1349_length_5137_cov_2.880905_2_plen_215_part_00
MTLPPLGGSTPRRQSSTHRPVERVHRTTFLGMAYAEAAKRNTSRAGSAQTKLHGPYAIPRYTMGYVALPSNAARPYAIPRYCTAVCDSAWLGSRAHLFSMGPRFRRFSASNSSLDPSYASEYLRGTHMRSARVLRKDAGKHVQARENFFGVLRLPQVIDDLGSFRDGPRREHAELHHRQAQGFMSCWGQSREKSTAVSIRLGRGGPQNGSSSWA